MLEYIDREKIEYWLLTESASLDTEEDRAYVVERLRKEIPDADVRPVTHGKWIEMYDPNEYSRHYWLCCSICGYVAPFGRMSDTELHTDFCPHCGAEMEE